LDLVDLQCRFSADTVRLAARLAASVRSADTAATVRG